MKHHLFFTSFLIFISYLILRILGFISISYLYKYCQNEISNYITSLTFYLFFLDISSLGIFPSISRLSSRLEEEEINYIVNKALKNLLIIGIAIFFIYQLIITIFYKAERFWYLELMSISFIYYSIIFFLRGIAQGRRKPFKVLLSLVIDGLIRILFIIIGLKCFKGERIIISFVFVGITTGSLCSFLYLYLRRPKGEEKQIAFEKELYSKALSILPITMFITAYHFIDIYSFKLLNISESMFNLINFKIERLIMLPVYFASIYSSLYLPYLIKTNQKYPFIKININLFLLTLFIYSKASNIFSLLYDETVGLQYFKYLIPVILLLSMIKMYISAILREESIYKLSIYFIIVIAFKLLINLVLGSEYRADGIIMSTYIILFLLIIGIIFYLKLHKLIKTFDIFTSFILIIVCFFLIFLFINILNFNIYLSFFIVLMGINLILKLI